MFRKCTLIACLLAAFGTNAANAQDAVLSELYGRGVHRYFAHDYVGAYDQLTLAIDNGSTDPRAFYFRGLVLLATGRIDEAVSDWRTGAAYEAKGSYGGVIGQALSRVQGPARLDLERIRQMARLQARSERSAQDRARYEQPAETPIPLQGADTAPATPPGPENPFGDDDVAGAVGEPEIEAENALEGALDNAQPEPVAPQPAGGQPQPADDAPGFGEPSGDDLPDFGDPAPSGDDPFGGDDPFDFGN